MSLQAEIAASVAAWHERLEQRYWLLSNRADEGAYVMDRIDPEWFWLVNPDRLDMRQGRMRYVDTRNKCGCVIAQHHPGHNFDYLGSYGLDLDDAVLLGLSSEASDDFPVLDALWRELIEDRRAAWLDKHPEWAS